MADPNIVEFVININWLTLILKIVGILFSLGYFIYALIYHQQLIKMERNALIYYHLLSHPDSTEKPTRPILFSFSMLQLLLGVILMIISLLML